MNRCFLLKMSHFFPEKTENLSLKKTYLYTTPTHKKTSYIFFVSKYKFVYSTEKLSCSHLHFLLLQVLYKRLLHIIILTLGSKLTSPLLLFDLTSERHYRKCHVKGEQFHCFERKAKKTLMSYVIKYMNIYCLSVCYIMFSELTPSYRHAVPTTHLFIICDLW